MKVSHSVLTVGVVGAFVSIASSAQPLVLTVATENCLTANQGLRAMAQGERLVSLYGVAFATDADVNTNTDQFVEDFLFDNAQANVDALGVDDAVLQLKVGNQRAVAGGAMPNVWHMRYADARRVRGARSFTAGEVDLELGEVAEISVSVEVCEAAAGTGVVARPAMLSAKTFCSFVREVSPPGPREDEQAKAVAR